MIWHIFRKDLKLLWRMVIGVALINLIDRAIQSGAGIFRNASVSPAVLLSGLLGTVSILATGVLIVMVVQQDSIPGLTQDWLVRPIRRRDLLLSKVLFVALAVQGPIFLIEVGQCLAAGFPLGPSLTAPLSRSAWMFLAMDLPVLAFATLVRNLTQAAGAAIAMVVGFALFTQGVMLYTNSLVNLWVTDSARVVWGLAGVAAVLALQYYRRKTTRARWAYGAAALVWLFLEFLPWQPAFAIEKRFSRQPAAADAVQIAFDPAFGKFRQQAGQREPIRFRASRTMHDVDVWAPLRVSGMSDRQILTADSMLFTIVVPGGAKIDLGRQGSPIPWDAEAPSHHYLLFIPEEIYTRLSDQPVTVEFDYSLTLLQAGPAQAIPATGGDQWVEGIGRCATRPSGGSTLVDVGCLAPGNMPCIMLSLEFSGMDGRSTHRDGCQPDYAPYVDHVSGDSISHFAREVSVIESRLKDARVVFTAYRPEAHFTRRVVIQNIRLSGWRSE